MVVCCTRGWLCGSGCVLSNHGSALTLTCYVIPAGHSMQKDKSRSFVYLPGEQPAHSPVFFFQLPMTHNNQMHYHSHTLVDRPRIVSSRQFQRGYSPGSHGGRQRGIHGVHRVGFASTQASAASHAASSAVSPSFMLENRLVISES